MSTVHCEHDEETVDLLVVGFGLAGASAALEAAAAGFSSRRAGRHAADRWAVGPQEAMA
ncbi:hypothetical protein [Pseudonocardia aurantiaca]|uniref:FAD-dependent oxidoreductase 2 FAD binding domain-containing protein n=1 Tax=Pseudonocardia aurantiaca TaxID=75290 RepID=A0ABW4FS08_9PSEU